MHHIIDEYLRHRKLNSFNKIKKLKPNLRRHFQKQSPFQNWSESNRWQIIFKQFLKALIDKK